MKKIISAVLSVIIICFVIPMTVSAAEGPYTESLVLTADAELSYNGTPIPKNEPSEILGGGSRFIGD
jgi:hypothetical protein